MRISQGFKVAEALGVQEIAGPGIRGLVAVTKGEAPPELRLIKDGVWIDSRELAGCGPGVLALVALVLGAAPRLSDMLARQPQIMDGLIDPRFFGAMPDQDELSARLAATLADANSYEEFLDRLRLFGQESLFLIGTRILSGTVSAQHASVAFADVAEGIAQFGEGAGSEGGDPQLTAGAQAAGQLRQRAARVAPLQGIAGPQGIEASARDGQVFEVGAQGLGDARRMLAEHGRCEVEGEQIGGRKRAFQPGEGVAGAAAGVEDALRGEALRSDEREEAVAGGALHAGNGVIVVGSLVEGGADGVFWGGCCSHRKFS